MLEGIDLARCHELQLRARRGWLTAVEREELADRTARLFEALAAYETRARGATPCRRRTLRIRRATSAELAWFGGEAKGVTRDLGTGGFSAIVGTPPPTGSVLVARLRLPGGGPLVAPARVVHASERRGTVAVSVALEELAAEDVARVRAALLDDALSLAALVKAATLDERACLRVG